MAKFNVWEAMKENGFVPMVDPYGISDGDHMMKREFSRFDEVLWYGQQEFKMSIVVRFSQDYDTVSVDYYDGFKRPFKSKVYANNKRTWNAICETAHFKGFEIQ